MKIGQTELKKLIKKLPKNDLTQQQILDAIDLFLTPKYHKNKDPKCLKCQQQISSFIITKFIRAYPLTNLINNIRKSASNVWNNLGHGWNEKVYQEAMKIELHSIHNIYLQSETPTSIIYQNRILGDGVYIRTDLVVGLSNTIDKQILLEFKAIVKTKANMEKAIGQCKRYLRLKNIPVGMVINFPDKLYSQPHFIIVFP